MEIPKTSTKPLASIFGAILVVISASRNEVGFICTGSIHFEYMGKSNRRQVNFGRDPGWKLKVYVSISLQAEDIDGPSKHIPRRNANSGISMRYPRYVTDGCKNEHFPVTL